MASWLCDIFKFLIELAEIGTEVIASVLKTIGIVAVDLLSDLIGAAGDAVSELFGSGGGVLLLGAGLLAFWMFFGKDKKEDVKYLGSMPNDSRKA